jgi:hypothetical protein
MRPSTRSAAVVEQEHRQMGTWRGTGRRALAVGAGALLIGALGAGPAYAGSDNDDDEYTYVDDSCSDYHYSWYFEHGYDYDEHWDDDWDHGDRDHGDWDHGKDWHRGDDWKKHWDDKDYYVKDGKVYDKKTNKPIFDLGSGKPIEIPVQDPGTGGNPVTDTNQTSLGATEKAPKAETQQAPVEKEPAATSGTKEETPSASTSQGGSTSGGTTQQKVTVPEVPKVEKQPTASTGSDGSSTTVENKAVVTDLAASNSWDDEDRDKDRDHDGDRDWDRDHGWWDGWWEKESHTVDVSCYEDKETDHRWYDDRPVGEIDATEVKTVPKGGVDTGN